MPILVSTVKQWEGYTRVFLVTEVGGIERKFQVKFLLKFHKISREIYSKISWNFTWSFKGLFRFLKFLISILEKNFGPKKPEGSGSVQNTAHFVIILITYPIHEEEMSKSKYFNDPLSDFYKLWYHRGVIASASVSLLVYRF